MKGRLSNEQLKLAIESGERRVKSIQAAIAIGFSKLYANQLFDLTEQIEREQKLIKKYKTLLKNRVQT